MADNVAITPGSGATIAADEVSDGTLGSVKVQYVKIMDGTLDGTTKATVDGSGLAVKATQTGTWTVQPGNTANTTPWLSKLHDGTNAVAVKAASTAPAATDPALVVSISPNSVNSNGQATMANSAPVVMASDFVGASGFMKKEDVPSADGDAGIPAMAIRQSSPANTSNTNGDYEMLQMNAGRLWVDASGVTLTVGSHAVTNAGTFAVQSAAAGDVAHDGVDSGNPVKNGFKATTALSGLTLVANADRTDGFAGVDGVQITRPHCNLEDIVTGNATNTDGTSTQCIAAQSAGIKTYLVSVVLCNTSATAITVDIKDGSTVKTSLPLPAGSGCVYNPPVPIPGTAATAWNFDGSAAATTVTCSMIGFKSKV